MAGKIRFGRAGLLVILALVGAGWGMSVLRVDPTEMEMEMEMEMEELCIETQPLAPRGVKITLWPIGTQDSVRITWQAVPGARGYKVYSAVCLPDATQWIAFLEPEYDEKTGEYRYIYKYSDNPLFGDVTMERLGQDGVMAVGTWGFPNSRFSGIVLSEWTEDREGIMRGCSYTRPLVIDGQGERDRMFRVTSIF